MGNPMVAAHGKVVLKGLERAVKNMDNIKATYAELSVLHSETLHVDPDNFRVSAHLDYKIIFIISIALTSVFMHPFCLWHYTCVLPQLLGDCLTIVVAAQLGASFTPEVQAAFQKFLAVAISSLTRQYH